LGKKNKENEMDDGIPRRIRVGDYIRELPTAGYEHRKFSNLYGGQGLTFFIYFLEHHEAHEIL